MLWAYCSLELFVECAFSFSSLPLSDPLLRNLLCVPPLAISTTTPQQQTTDAVRVGGLSVVARAYACFVAASSSCWRRGTISAGLG